MLRSVSSTRPDEVGIDPDAAALLLDMERALHVSALPADVVEERVREMAIGLGMAAEIFTSQSFTATELRAGKQTAVEIRRIPFDPHWNLTRISDLLALARAVAERRIPITEAGMQLRSITSRANRYPKWLVVIGYAVYAAAVAARVGGRSREMAVALCIGAIIGGIGARMLASAAPRRRRELRPRSTPLHARRARAVRPRIARACRCGSHPDRASAEPGATAR